MSSLPVPSPLRRRWFLFKTPVDETLTASAVFSCLLVALRVMHTGRPTFIFMPWNLFLAYVPYFVSSWLTRPGRRLRPVVKAIGLAGWLLFIPNSFYILTDLYHLADGHRDARVPEWYDLVLILSFALSGTLIAVMSTRQIEGLILPRAGFRGRWAFLFPLMFLNALGVYLGRYLRYNSWDIFTNPVDLAADICGMILHPLHHPNAWGMIGCYSILLSLIYNLLTKITDHGKYDRANLEP
ncbi:MAG TPA: DUF1361 domain-containing protein [Puia sp.]|nr:DUF1361 domain-containing protein [Puia sp.]